MEIKFSTEEVCAILERHVSSMLGLPLLSKLVKANSDSYTGLKATVTVDPVDSERKDAK
tara:strand:+ start:330 stop:506 length:177 start_codon:yes stop_codon:yes gene_type:complete